LLLNRLRTSADCRQCSRTNGGTGLTLDVGLIALVAPFLYLLETHLVDSGSSIFAIGLLHAFNAAGHMGAVPGGWHYAPAMIMLTVV
jgi:hypothetical protein